MHFFAHRRPFLSWPRIFPRAHGCGARHAGGPGVHHGASAGPGRAPCRVRALGVQSRAGGQVITASLSAKPEQTRAMETPKTYFFLRSAVCYKEYYASPQTLYTLTQSRDNSSRASSFSLCESHERYCLCVCHPRILQHACLFVAVLLSPAVYVAPRPPSSLYVVATMVQQQPHSKVFPYCVRVSVRVCHPEHNLDDFNPQFL